MLLLEIGELRLALDLQLRVQSVLSVNHVAAKEAGPFSLLHAHHAPADQAVVDERVPLGLALALDSAFREDFLVAHDDDFLLFFGHRELPSK